MDVLETKCICIYHKGAYDNLGTYYAKIMKYIEDFYLSANWLYPVMKYIEDNKLEIQDFPRECYIDGIWNKDNIDDWLTEIQVPVKQSGQNLEMDRMYGTGENYLDIDGGIGEIKISFDE